MRVIKSGNKDHDAEDVPCLCIVCGCQFLFRPSEARYIEDLREGNYYRVACPECNVLNSVNVRLRGTMFGIENGD